MRDLFIPNSTQIPDVILDVWMAKLTGAEFKVLVYICRRTYGFRKESDSISVSQIATGIVKRNGERLDRGTGISESSIKANLANLEKYGIVSKSLNQRADGSFLPSTYTISIPHEAGGVGQPLAPQHTEAQNTVLHTRREDITLTAEQGGLTDEELQSEPLPRADKRGAKREQEARFEMLTELYAAWRFACNGTPMDETPPTKRQVERYAPDLADLLETGATVQTVVTATKKLMAEANGEWAVTPRALFTHWERIKPRITQPNRNTPPAPPPPPSPTAEELFPPLTPEQEAHMAEILANPPARIPYDPDKVFAKPGAA